jgi:DNA end-binding protein Ku
MLLPAAAFEPRAPDAPPQPREGGRAEPMARAIWTGSISFGLVEIPVTAHTAEDPSEEIRFNLLDKRTMKPVGYVRVNKETGKEVPWDEIVRGYEYEKGEYVLVTDEELRRANVEKSETIDIVAFVELASIEPFFYEKPYYLKPVRKGGKGYALLHETLVRTGKAGIARVVFRTRQHIAALLPRGPALGLVLLRYADELKSPEAVGVEPMDAKALDIKDKELDLAEQLVDGMTEVWDPEKFHDEYREDVMALIERKIKAGKTQEVLLEDKPRKRAAEVLDLMPLLQKSLGAKPATKKRAAAERPRTATKRARRGA